MEKRKTSSSALQYTQLGSHPQKPQTTVKRAMTCILFLFVLSYGKTCVTKVTNIHSPQAINNPQLAPCRFYSPVIPAGKYCPSSSGHGRHTALRCAACAPHQPASAASPGVAPHSSQFTCSFVLSSSQNWPHHGGLHLLYFWH